MGIHYVHPGPLVAAGVQLPPAPSGPWEPRAGPKCRNGLREVWASPQVWEKREGKGLPGAQGLQGSPTVGMRGRSLLEGSGKTGWTGQHGLGYPSLAKPGGERGCKYQLRSIETAPWAESPVL